MEHIEKNAKKLSETNDLYISLVSLSYFFSSI